MTDELLPRVALFVVMLGSGIVMLWTAQAAASGRLGRNPLAGIRIRSTMASDRAWLVAHARAKRPLMYAGFSSMAVSLLAVPTVPMHVLAVGVILGCLAMLGFVLYGARVGSRAATEISQEEQDGATEHGNASGG